MKGGKYMFKAWFAHTEKPIKLEPYVGDLKDINGWLDRDGVLYRCNYVDHSVYADKLCEKYGYRLTNKFPFHRNGEYTLEQNGWAKISNGKVHYASKKPISKKQLDILFDYFVANGYDFKEYQQLFNGQENIIVT